MGVMTESFPNILHGRLYAWLLKDAGDQSRKHKSFFAQGQ